MPDALDNPIWTALTTEQAHLAERDGDAARFPPDLTALAGLADDDALPALARLVQPGERCGVFLAGEVALPAPLFVRDEAPVLQMVHDGATPASADRFDELGPDDA